MTVVYLLFYESVLPTFTHVNLLQREDPNIYLVASAIRSFLKKLLSKFVTLQAIRAEQDDTTKVSFQNPANHLGDHAITIGMVTKERLRKLLNDGDISANDEKKFYAGVRAFYIDAASQALKCCHSMIIFLTMQCF